MKKTYMQLEVFGKVLLEEHREMLPRKARLPQQEIIRIGGLLHLWVEEMDKKEKTPPHPRSGSPEHLAKKRCSTMRNKVSLARCEWVRNPQSLALWKQRMAEVWGEEGL